MDATQIKLIQDSFDKVEPIAEDAARIFYDHLFAIAPHTQAYFSGDIGAQGMKLMTTLGVVVRGLDQLDQILPVAQELAYRHTQYGVRAKDYEPVGEALIHTLKTGLGDGFTPDLQTAWQSAYSTLSAAMIDAAYGTKEAVK